MQGIFVHHSRPASKKLIKEALQSDPASVYIEATSLFGNEYDGPASNLPVGQRIAFVGPDPERSRKFYGTIKSTPQGLKLA